MVVTIARLFTVIASMALLSCAPLGSGYVLSGTVTEGGAPVSGVTVSLEGSGATPATTGTDGTYELFPAPYGSWQVVARKAGMVFVPRHGDPAREGSTVFLGSSHGTVLDFLAADAGSVTIPMLQGRGFESPLEGQEVRNVVGVVTRVTRKTPHAIYETVLTDGSTTPQWVGDDGFFMEAFGSGKDGDPLTSDGVFVYAHNDAYVDSKWLDSVPSDLAPGDVVSVSGIVRENRPKDRFNNSEGYLTFTRIERPTVFRVTEAGVPVTRTTSFPAGVLLTYDDTPTLPAGVTEYRVLPWQTAGLMALRDAELVMESVEGMVVRVNDPLVSSCTYYNVTGILADSGRKDGVDNANLNAAWKAIVLQDPDVAGMDFNPELLFCDYQSPDWATFDPIPQVGDRLVDSDNATVLRGVMEYTFDALYVIKPLQFTVEPTNGATVIPSQGWNFTAAITTPNMKDLSTANRTTIRNWRIGSSADARFRAPSTWGPTPEAGYIKVASFNIENFEGQGKPYAKDVDIADVIVGNLRCPDVVVVIEMGDDVGSTIVYENQDNSYAIPDGVVTSVLNFRAIIAAIKSASGLDYDFRCIDPEENRDGGEPGTNIRVGFLFRTDTLSFVDRGLPTNHLTNTAGTADTWPVTFPSPLASALATTATAIVRDPVDGSPALSQSPGRIIGSAFSGSTRKPLVGEFVHNTTNKKFFVVAAHLGSKTGDTPLYGEQQPPVFGSDSRRADQGRAIASFVQTLLAADPGAKVVVGGDMNDFPWADSMDALTGISSGDQVLFSPSERYMPANERWTYAFRGNLQQIDHIFASSGLMLGGDAAALLDWTRAVFIAHIDAPFSKNNHIQTSDHDAIIARFKIGD